MEDLYNIMPCRQNQLDDLIELLRDRDEPLPCPIFINGSMATGKSLCVESVLQYLGYTYVVIDCVECYTTDLIYESILSGFEDDVNCESMFDLINGLNRLQSQIGSCEPLVLVFDRAESLQSVDLTVIPELYRLREHCNINICTIFITHLNYENFFFKIAQEPVILYFPNYNKEELFKIISLHQKNLLDYLLTNYEVDKDIKIELEKPELFANFLNSFLSVFYRPCRDLIELQYMARVNFVKYCEPIIRNEIQASDLTKLWHYIAPILKSNLELLYLRISSSKQKKTLPSNENGNCPIIQDYNFENDLKDELASSITSAQVFELPFYTKYMLIAAYLASYNPRQEDKRLFMKNHGMQRKTLQQVEGKISEKLNTQLGPKVFTLGRLLAIFNAIIEKKIALTSIVLAQIATLVELNLIAGDTEVDLDSAVYICIVGYDIIYALAQTIEFDVEKYLYDFI